MYARWSVYALVALLPFASIAWQAGDADRVVEVHGIAVSAAELQRIQADADARQRSFAAARAAPSASSPRGGSFVNWESPHVHPLDLTPDGARLLAVNTSDHRLEVFEPDASGLTHVASIPVGLEPVSVRALDDATAWVVNHVSDSISIVDLATLRVSATVHTGDEPADVIFAGSPLRAFVSISQENRVDVYDAEQPGAPLAQIAIAGEEPRALATDGAAIYAAIFESGNATTVVPQGLVSSVLNPYPGDPNPPPNSGLLFDPPLSPGLPPAPPGSIIVQRQPSGAWRDDNGRNWSLAIGWNLHDHDVAMIDVASLAVTYIPGLMNANMAIATRADGRVTVVGTDARNVVRFEPNLNGTFLRVLGASIDPAAPASPTIVDLNPHLDYASPTVPQALRDQSLGDPRAILWTADGQTGFIAGMGSSTVIVVDGGLARLGAIELGRGPTGLALDEPGGRLYALNRFDGSVSVVALDTLAEVARVTFFDPTPGPIREGREYLYDTRLTSGLGHTSCASCHIDARTDGLAWDLGDPSGDVRALDQECGSLQGCPDWHPMRGVMTTQTLQDFLPLPPFNWRGDFGDLAAFNTQYRTLQGDDELLDGEDLSELAAFLNSVELPPNPYRNLDGSFPTAFPNGGDPNNGEWVFENVLSTQNLVTCAACHTLPQGTNLKLFPIASQSLKVPQLRNLYEKHGFDIRSSQNSRGFGFTHTGAISTLYDFLTINVTVTEQQRLDLEAFLNCLSSDTHAAVGQQVTIVDGSDVPTDALARLDALLALADAGTVGLIVHGPVAGEPRGYAYAGGGLFQSDRAGESVSAAALLAAAEPGAELTWTAVPAAAQTRLGLDRDEDGALDGDERDACSDPADAASVPGGGCGCVAADLDDDGTVGLSDLSTLLTHFGLGSGAAADDGDLDQDGDVDLADLSALLEVFGLVCT